MKYLITLLAVFALSGCAYFSDAIGLNYDTEADYRAAVDTRLAERDLDPVVEEAVRAELYALWTKSRTEVLDGYELDEAVKAVIINKLAQ